MAQSDGIEYTPLEKFEEYGVKWATSIRTIEINDKGIIAIDMKSGKKVSYPADTVVLAVGLEPVNGLAESLKGKVPEVYTIGDCVKPQKVKDAIYQAAVVARRI